MAGLLGKTGLCGSDSTIDHGAIFIKEIHVLDYV